MENSTKIGGITRTSGANRTGRGPVYEISVALGMTQQQMSEALGLSKSAIRLMEYEGRGPTNKLARGVLRQLAWRMDAGDKRTEVLTALGDA